MDAKARRVMPKLYTIFELIDTLGIDCQNTIAIENKDYEDAIMVESAVVQALTVLLTEISFRCYHKNCSTEFLIFPFFQPEHWNTDVMEERQSCHLPPPA